MATVESIKIFSGDDGMHMLLKSDKELAKAI